MLLLAQCKPATGTTDPIGTAFISTEDVTQVAPSLLSTPSSEHTPTVMSLLSYDEFMEAMSGLDRTLSTHESETYAGLCIPTPGRREAVIAFTTDAAETARPYLVGQRYETQVRVETADFPLELLKGNLRAEFERLTGLGFDAVGRVDLCENRIVLDVLSRTDVEVALKTANVQLPNYVKLVEVESMPTLESP